MAREIRSSPGSARVFSSRVARTDRDARENEVRNRRGIDTSHDLMFQNA
jgi:hypothetical protein